MIETIGTDASRALEAYVPGDRRLALAAGTSLPDRVNGAALFADISGFTPLTETLAQELGPQRGAEELTSNLSRLFRGLVTDVERLGGHVICFNGDAITCWLDGDDGARATACALTMQRTMGDIGEVVTPGGLRVRIALKTAVAAGSARRFVVGDPDIQLFDVLAGRLVDLLSTAEQLAQRNEVVLDDSALTSLGDRVDVHALRIDAKSGRRFGVVTRLGGTVPEPERRDGHAALSSDVLKRWLLPAVFERLSTGHAEFLAELRQAYPMFVHFGGTDYDADDDAIDKLDTIVRRAQNILTSYGGNVLQVTLGDKGGYLYAVLGAPHAHENDAARAAAAALELRELGTSTAATSIQIGISAGRLLSGTYGHDRRQVFSCLGDAVNLAARLMDKAPPACIYVSAALRQAADDAFAWDELEPIKVKGIAAPVATFALRGSKRRASTRTSAELPIIGRDRELSALNDALRSALDGQGRVVGISAEAGMGKSRLIAELLRTVRHQRVATAQGECYSYGTNARYFVWRNVWSQLFGLDDEQSADERIRSLDAQLMAIDPELVPRAPLLSAVLDLPMPETDLTASLDAKSRKTSLESLLVESLRAMSSRAPIVIVLEDCHWLDSLSRDLLVVLARSIAGQRVLLLTAYRPAVDVGGGTGIETLPHFSEIALAELDNAQSSQLIRSKIDQLLGTDTPPAATLTDLIAARAQGNPFYIEELLRFIRSKGVALHDESALRRLELPTSLHSLLLSRIDTLAEAPRQTLKVASVVGRTFHAAMLPGIYPDLGSIAAVNAHLHTLEANGLVNVDQGREGAYLFKHVVTQEVTYESMPFAFRAALHERAGRYVEESEPDEIDQRLDLLAHHYWHSNNRAKKCEFLRRAGEAAQASYANPAAIDYFERLSPLLDERGRIDVLLKLGKVHEHVGNWQRAEEVEKQALSLAEALDDSGSRAASEAALAEVARKHGHYDESFALLDRARQRFELLGDDGGVASVLHLTGTVAAQRGDYDRALASYHASLRLRERQGDKASMGSLLSNLGVVAEYRGDYPAARAYHERALALRSEIGDRWGVGRSTNNLGMIAFLQNSHAEARQWFDKSMQLSREVGDAWMVAIVHNNLGNAIRGLGDYGTARRHYAESLRAYRSYDDRWALAFLLEDIAVMAALDGDPCAALELIGAADRAREAIGAPRAPSLDEELDRTLAPSIARIAPDEQSDCRARGRARDFGAAIDYALEICARAPVDARAVIS
ncbi:MAG TPA: tetratricopeptide repeat protein [Casimicrobiaceae bacterium]